MNRTVLLAYQHNLGELAHAFAESGASNLALLSDPAWLEVMRSLAILNIHVTANYKGNHEREASEETPQVDAGSWDAAAARAGAGFLRPTEKGEGTPR